MKRLHEGRSSEDFKGVQNQKTVFSDQGIQIYLKCFAKNHPRIFCPKNIREIIFLNW
jgi:hypothetical protein